ncbi:MerR family transcriptional regulator [Streptomyces sp. AD16]|nr:MerR family transcriptional regulator [Streptomyces sp. AD16]
MAWSTREMAELAGVSLRAVRHYHDIGLIEEPERRSNGYKQYGVSHLVRLLRIKRLTALGFSLSQIADMDDDPDSGPDPRDLRALDAELAATIERLQHARAEVGALLRGRAASDLPSASPPWTRQPSFLTRTAPSSPSSVRFSGPVGWMPMPTCSSRSRSPWHVNSTSFPPMPTS